MRFKQYDTKWNSALLEQVVSIYDGTHQTPTYTESGVKFVSVENIKNLYASNKYISYTDFKENYKIIPQEGDILMTRIGDIGTPTLVTSNEDLAYYVSLALLKVSKNITAKYLLQYIQTRFFKKELWEKTLHIAFPIKINKGDIGLCKIQYPNIFEQEQIAHFLALIDRRIETQSKIIEDIKLQKKSIIDRIFCDIGLFPNGREVKLREILQEGSKIPVDTAKYKKITIKLYLGGLEYTEQGRSMKDTRPFYVRHKGELIIGKQNYFNGSIALIEDEFDGCICSNAIMSFAIAPSVNSIFLFHAISNADFLKMRAYYANGTGQKELSEKDFLNFCIKLPMLEEQIKVAKLLLGLDKKIEIEKDILTAYKKQKAYLLREMFI